MLVDAQQTIEKLVIDNERLQQAENNAEKLAADKQELVEISKIRTELAVVRPKMKN